MWPKPGTRRMMPHRYARAWRRAGSGSRSSLAALCLLATRWTGAVFTVVLLIVALCFVLDGATKWFEGTGGMPGHRQ